LLLHGQNVLLVEMMGTDQFVQECLKTECIVSLDHLDSHVIKHKCQLNPTAPADHTCRLGSLMSGSDKMNDKIEHVAARYKGKLCM